MKRDMICDKCAKKKLTKNYGWRRNEKLNLYINVELGEGHIMKLGEAIIPMVCDLCDVRIEPGMPAAGRTIIIESMIPNDQKTAKNMEFLTGWMSHYLHYPPSFLQELKGL